MGSEATATVVPPSPGKLPGISVSDAFGLPDNWTLAESLKGEQAKGSKMEVEPEKGEGTPDPDAMEQQKADEKAAAEKKTIDDDKAAAETAAAAKAPKTEKPAAAPKTEKPAAPAAGAKPAVKPAAAAPAAPTAEPKKFTIGGKEYTEDELKKKLETPAAPAPAAPAKPAPEAKKEPTAEEKAAESAKTDKLESEWIAGTAQTLKPAAVDEATMEKILTGGKDAVTEFDRIRREDMARTVLAVRKDLGELYKPFFEAVTQMQQGQMTREDERMWGEFTTAHPSLAQYETLVKQHAAALVESDPDSVSKMSEKDFNAKVAELTTGYIRQFNAKFGEPEEGSPAAPAPGAAPAPAAVSAAAKTLAAAKPARVTPKPPAGSLPAGAPSSGGGRGGNTDFQKSAVASLM